MDSATGSSRLKLTCVTATFNVLASGNGEALRRCVASVARLAVPHEHLIYDGASTDGTVELLRELAMRAPNVKVVSERDSGIYNALNKGVRDARGAWFHVLGADDEIVDADAMVRALSEGERRNADLVASPVWWGEVGGRTYPVQPHLALGAMPFPHQGVLMRTELVRRLGGFVEKFRIGADKNLLLSAVLANARVVCLERPFALFGDQGTSSDVEKCRQENISFYAAHYGLSSEESLELYDRRVLPLRVVFRKLVHASPVVRRSARFYLMRGMLDLLGLLDAHGSVRVLR